MIEVFRASGGYFNKIILEDLSFQVNKGEFFGVIGPNGSGKTTLLKMISNILPARSGKIMIDDKPVSAYSTKDLARVVAVLPQNIGHSFSYTVKETVSLGRYAHQSGLFQTFGDDDERIVQDVMEQTGITYYAEVPIDKLSGGERQRVFLAQALAQDPEILLLDEPTNHLDLAYQKELLDVLKTWTREKDLTVVSIFHDLNLAGLYCDRLLLLHNGGSAVCAKPDDVLKKDRIEAVYGAQIEKHPHPKVPRPQMMLVPAEQNHSINDVVIDENMLRVSNERITLNSPIALRTMSSGVTGSGFGWHRSFVNRHVGNDYDCHDHKEEMTAYLHENGFSPSDAVGMMTAVTLTDVSYRQFVEDGFSLLAVVTAGVGNAADATRGNSASNANTGFIPGTINIWLFVNGTLSDEAFIQCIMTATEAKTQALRAMDVRDGKTNTYATGTSTDSILIAATQQGRMLEYSGSATQLGQLIGKGVFYCTKEALAHYFNRYDGAT